MNKDKQKPMKNIARLHCFIDGAKAIHANAAALYEEAQILGQAGAFARAAQLCFIKSPWKNAPKWTC
ncbi:hypothetical protein JAK24_13405 [Stenotrophomonas maltophilia]|nr:hypothetical protein [Stenotrophomonas maltophilia]